jgi:SAM-dependent methyltransferase
MTLALSLSEGRGEVRSPVVESPSYAYIGTELHALAEARNYYRWVISRFAPFLGKRVIEIGAGIGTFSRSILTHTTVSELVMVEPGDNLVPLLQKRFAGEPRVKIIHGYFQDLKPSTSADSVVLVNVLEHVAEDRALLNDVREVLTPGGTLLLLVPALSLLYGTLDVAFGHYRRYNKPSLADKLQEAGFQVLFLSYFNLPGTLGWFLTGRVLRRRTLKPRHVRLYDRWVIPWLSRLEERWTPPLGQSLMAIARKIEPALNPRLHGISALQSGSETRPGAGKG